jgi:hypothetical protein
MTALPRNDAPPSREAGDTSPISWLGPRAARILALALLIVGVEAWLLLSGDYGHRYQPQLALGAVVLGFIPIIRRWMRRLWIAIEHPSPRAQLATALILAVICSAYLYWTERGEGIWFGPTYHDESSYLIQTRMLAQGRLFLPAHPLAPFFETFYLLTERVYASMYFPGTALMYVPIIWLRLPYYVGPLIVYGLSAGILYLIVAELLDGGSAMLTVLLLLSLRIFRMTSIMFLAQGPVLLLGLVMTYACLRWRRNRSWGWAALLGAAAGWAGITRPVDGLVFAIVLGIVILFDLRSQPVKVWLKTAIIVLIAASPFLLLQLKFNHDVTGQWLQTPFTDYTRRYYPGLEYGLGSAPDLSRYVSDLPQKQLVYERLVNKEYLPLQWSNLPRLLMRPIRSALNNGVLNSLTFILMLLPLSILGLWNRRLWMVWGVVPIFILLYAGYPIFIRHYLVTIFPALAFLLVMPIRILSQTFPRQRDWIHTSMPLAIIALAAASLPQFDRSVHDPFMEAKELESIDRKLAQVDRPAIVLFHFNPTTDSTDLEPVYNSDVAWPDDAPLIRAHDLNATITAIGKPGDRDLPLYQYYSRIDPQRIVYLYERHGGNGRLVRLGTVTEMAKRTVSSDAQSTRE